MISMSITASEAARAMRSVNSERQKAAARANGKLGGRPILAVHPRIGGPRRVQFRKEDEGGYSVRVPSLPGCYSQGENKEEALANITEAIELHIEVMQENGLKIPHDLTIKIE